MPRKTVKTVKPVKTASKSELIREMGKAIPGAGPTEIAERIKSLYDVKVSPAMVSTVLSQARSRGGKVGKRGRPTKPRVTSAPSAATPADEAVTEAQLRKTAAFASAYGYNGSPRTDRLAAMIRTTRRERAMSLIIEAAEVGGGMDEVARLVTAFQGLIKAEPA